MSKYDLSNLNEGFFSSLAKIGKNIMKAINPSDRERLRRDLKEAKEEGRYWDAKYIEKLLSLLNKKSADLTMEEEGELYLLTRAYIELPKQLRSAETSQAVQSGIYTIGSYAQRRENQRLRDQLDARDRADSWSRAYNMGVQHGRVR